MKKILLAAGVVVVLLLASGLALLAFGRKTERPVDVITASPSPIVQPTDGQHPEGDVHETEAASNPALRKLPHQTRYWKIDFDGSVGDKYRFEVIVTVVHGEDTAAAIDRQRPYVEAFLREIGQPDGTYILRFETDDIEHTESS